MKKEKIDNQFLFIKIGIYGFIICGALFQWFGPGLIKAYKQEKETEQIWYGGSPKKVNKHITKRNNKVVQLNDLINNQLKNLDSLSVYTNDSCINVQTLIRANRKYRDTYRNTYEIGRNYITESNETIKHIENYLDKQDSLGFNVFYKGSTLQRRYFRLLNLNKSDTLNKYKIVQYYYYTEKQKEQLAKKIENKKYFIAKTKEEELKELHDEQYSQIIISENELQNQKIENSFKAILGPKIGMYKKCYFYFTCFNKQLDEKTFKNKIVLFKNMFMKRKNLIGDIKKMKIVNPVKINKEANNE